MTADDPPVPPLSLRVEPSDTIAVNFTVNSALVPTKTELVVEAILTASDSVPLRKIPAFLVSLKDVSLLPAGICKLIWLLLAAGSVVTKDVGEYEIVAGVPARRAVGSVGPGVWEVYGISVSCWSEYASCFHGSPA